MFLLARDGFLNHCPMKPLVICQPLSKFDMFIFIISHKMYSILFFLEMWGPEFCILGGITQKRGQFLKGN